MSEHVIVGAGAVGSATALELAGRGERVRIVSRHGHGPAHPAIERVAADATDAEHLAKLAVGAVALYNCANPQYHQWFTDWPPLAAALLAAAEQSGAVLATMSNLYGYGPVDGPITARTAIGATHPEGVAIVEAALLVEAGVADRFDRLVVVTCNTEQRAARFAARQKVELETARKEVERRMAAQLPDEEKINSADYVIDNSGSLDHTREQAKQVWEKLRTEAEKS